MSYNWGPHYIVPSEIFKTYSGSVLLREEFDEDLLRKELEELGFTGRIVRINNPWYYRKKDTDTWIQIGESQDSQRYFPVTWDTTKVGNGQYEVIGLMHVFVEEDGKEKAIARENVVEVTVKN
jgi:protoporphyrinogen oxidase